MTIERVLLSISIIVFLFGGMFVEIFAMDKFLWYRSFLWSLILFVSFLLFSVAIFFVVNLVENKSDDVDEQ